MKQLTATITATQPLSDALRLVTLAAPDLPRLRAGQVILVRASPSFEPYLRAPFFPMPSATSLDGCAVLVGRDVPAECLY